MKNAYKTTALIAGAMLLVSFLLPVIKSNVAKAVTPPTTIFSDGFGTGSTATPVPGWNDGGIDGDDSQARASGSGNDSASSDGGRFAIMFGNSGWICKTVDATGFNSLELSYYWRGDSDAENSSDDGIVEYKLNGNCSDANNTWTQLKNHDLRQDSSWTTQSAFGLDSSLNNRTFLLRFRTDTNASDEHFRIDGVSLTGYPIPINHAPVISSVNITPSDPKTNDTLTANVSASDSDGDSLTYTYQWKKNGSNISGATHQTLNMSISGNGRKGDHMSVVVTANDGKGGSDTETSSSVTVLNSMPVANDDSYTINEDNSLWAPFLWIPGIKDNDTDDDNDSLSFSLISNVTNGTLDFHGNGSFSYTPTNNYNGSDLFTYRVNDGTDNSNVATVTININPVNDAPILSFIGNKSLNEGETLSFTISSSDIDGGIPTYSAASLPTGATLDSTTGAFSWTPTFEQAGNYHVTFYVSDGNGKSDHEHVVINVGDVNGAPNLNHIDDITINEGETASFTASASDPEGDSFDFSLSGAPSGASIDSETGVFSWTTAETDGPGTYTFDVIVTDVNSNYDQQTVAITVNEMNVSPTTENQEINTNEDTPIDVTLTGNDTDLPANTLSYSIYTNPTHGSANLVGNIVTYTPDLNYNGTDSFIFEVADGQGGTVQGTVSIAINAVPDAPIADNLELTIYKNTPTWFDITASDGDGDPLTYIIVDQPTVGDISDTAPHIKYTSGFDMTGPDSFTFKVNDGTTDSNVATVSITVVEVPVGGGCGGECQSGSSGQVLGASIEATPTPTPEITPTPTPTPEVLGEVACTELITDYLWFGKNNNSDQVKLLQQFLNEQINAGLPITGLFGTLTRTAVSAFQEKYSDKILQPWLNLGLLAEKKGTGSVYKTTKWWINMISCPSLNLAQPIIP